MTGDPVSENSRKRRAVIQIIVRTIIMAISVYVIFGAMLYIFQRDFMYTGTKLAAVGTPQEKGITELSDVTFTTADGLAMHGWFAPPTDSGKPVILFFHGNGSNIAGFWPKAKLYFNKGYGVFLCEYRGYGGTPGKTTEQGIYTDSEGCLAALKGKGYGPDNIVYYGESLGSGVAVNLAVKNTPKAVVLECPYTSTVAVAKRSYGWYPVDLLMRDQFNSIGKIKNVTAPVFIIHGGVDSLIPVTEGKRLYEAANVPKSLHVIASGNHSDLYAFGAGDIILGWLDVTVTGGDNAVKP